MEKTLKSNSKFLSTPSARRATVPLCAGCKTAKKFLSTPSARRATLMQLADAVMPATFLSTPSARRATPGLAGRHHRCAISIHALREEGDAVHRPALEVQRISIHALREEGDADAINTLTELGKFLSTPSARRATAHKIHDSPPNVFLSTPSARRATPLRVPWPA